VTDTTSGNQGPTVAVGAVVVNDGALLMVQRAQDPGRGLWSIPGGRVERGEYLADALAREVKEETDLDVEIGDLLGIAEVVGDPHYVILDFEASLSGTNKPTAAGDVADVRWVALDEIETLDCTPRFVEFLRAWRVLAE
jgi:8-oxo-dGTP diphosphatase